ncbi:hypothetical protein D3C81_1561010 [compost metagenome]
MLIHRVTWQRRAPYPNLGKQILTGCQANVPPPEALLELASRRQRHDRPIHGHCSFGRDIVAQPLQRTRLTRQQLHEFDAATRQLLDGLLPVTAIGPHPCKIRCDHQRTHRAIEARQPPPPLPVAR